MTRELFGRSEHVAVLAAFAEDVRRGPAALVIDGEAGIGKTALWEAGVEAARGRGDRVLACRADAGEAALSFAGVGDLLADELDETLDLLTGPRRRALEVALLLDEPDADPPEPHAAALGFLDVLRAAAAHGPVLLAVDDVQWLDRPTARVLQFALRRLRTEPVGFLATVRTAPGATTPLDIDRSFADRPLARIAPGPLSANALHRLLAARLDLELAPPELARVRDVSGGNPFYALELGRARKRPGAERAGGRSLPLPESLKALVGDRIARLTAPTREVLLAAAAMSRPTVPVLAAALGDQRVVEAGLEEAARAGVADVDGARITFTHPLLGAVCYEDVPPWRRRAVHRALAAVVSDVEEGGRHLALATERPDALVARTLDAAAAAAAARGAPAAAAELGEQAAQLTPPSEAPARARRVLLAAEMHRIAGDRARAAALLRPLLAEAPSGVERADILFALARARQDDLPGIAALCGDALASAADDDARCAEILVFRSWMQLLAGRVRDALADARAALQRAERVGEPVLLARSIARVAMAETWTLDATPGLLERGVALEVRLDRPFEFHESPGVTLARRLMCQSEFDAALAPLERARRRAAAVGDEGSQGHVLFHLFQAEWFAGRWERAGRHATTLRELAEQLGDRQFRGISLYAGALLDAHMGRVAAARTAAEEALNIAEAVSDELFAVQSRTVLGFIDLSLGDVAAADCHLRPLPAWLMARGWDEPTDFAWTNAIEALIAIGETGPAAAYLAEYERRAQRAESPWALATAARCRGLLTAARGDLPTAFAAFDEALAHHERMRAPFERARTWLALGSLQRRARRKRATRETLEGALAAFEALGAELWANRAREELRRISGRRAAPTELTESERRVALLAGEGRSNKEIAAALQITVHTVEAHLSRVYRKLGVRSRAELAHRAAANV